MAVKIFSNQNGEAQVLISGDIDHHSSAKMREEIDSFIEKEHPRVVILDFSGVNFMDTSGIGLILGRFKITNRLGINLEVVNMNSRVRRITEFSGIKSLGILK